MRAWEYSRRGEWRKGKGHGDIRVLVANGETLAKPEIIPADRYVHNHQGRAEVRAAQFAEIIELGPDEVEAKLVKLMIKLPIRNCTKTLSSTPLIQRCK